MSTSTEATEALNDGTPLFTIDAPAGDNEGRVLATDDVDASGEF